MKSYEDILSITVGPSSTLIDAMSRLNSKTSPLVLVIDDNNVLHGAVTDGDIRRALLRGVGTTDTIDKAMHRTPVTVSPDSSHQERLSLMRSHGLSQLPIVVLNGVLLGITSSQGIQEVEIAPNHAVIMCGGLGSRMAALTAQCPKPMLEVAGRPMLEWIVRRLVKSGVVNIYLAINYLGSMIEEYFGDGSRWNANINYLREKRRMGTAGALSLLPIPPSYPVLVMNGDVMTKMAAWDLMDFHKRSGSIATVAIAEYKHQNPYGVVMHENNKFIGIEEKPVTSCFVSAGIYAISPELIALMKRDTPLDMPALLEMAQNEGREISVYPLYEYWADIGKEADYRKVQDVDELFD